MKKQNTSFLKWNINVLVSSLKKINLNIILIVILDTLFYLLSRFLVIFWLQRIQIGLASFNLPSDIASVGLGGIQQLVSSAKTFYFLIIFSFILVIIAIIFLASILKGIIWAKTTNTKISFNLISKFLMLNLIWMGFWFALVFLISFFVEPSSVLIFMITTTILALYFTNTLYTIFMKEHRLKAIIDAIKINIAKIHLFLLPYSVISIIFLIVIRIGNLLKFKYSGILFNLIIIAYIAIVRYYISTLVLEIEKFK